jgi:hypothetical protein
VNLFAEKFSSLREQVPEYAGFMVASNAPRVSRGQSYRNPFDVPRTSLLDQLVRMRSNFARPTTSLTRSLLHDEGELRFMEQRIYPLQSLKKKIFFSCAI